MNDINRREFLGNLATASALTIVPRRVLGGRGYIAPSDMILLAQVGCGTQAQRQVNTGMVARQDLQFVAVVDPNKDSQDYLDWEPYGNRAPNPPLPRRRQLGRRRFGDPRRPRRRQGNHGGVLQETRGVRAPASDPTKTIGRCSRRSPTSRGSSTSRRITSMGASTSRR